MARKLGYKPERVAKWKRVRRVPAQQQDMILKRAAELDIPLTAEDVVFPFPEDRELARS